MPSTTEQWPHEMPMKGLGIGQQLGWLTEQLADTATCAAG
jgi:hypothetical protein